MDKQYGTQKSTAGHAGNPATRFSALVVVELTGQVR
jgi:hypothetical protein